jgi:hypothetical protein
MIRQGRRVDEADLTNKAIEANKAGADKAEDVNEAIVVVKAKVEEAIVADEANVANKTNEANKADKADVAKNKVVVFVELPVLHPFSLTKCTAIFVEVKGCFGIFNNQLGGLTC